MPPPGQEDDGPAAADRGRGAGNPVARGNDSTVAGSRELSPEVPAAVPKQERLVGLGRSLRAKSPMGGASAHGSSACGLPLGEGQAADWPLTLPLGKNRCSPGKAIFGLVAQTS